MILVGSPGAVGLWNRSPGGLKSEEQRYRKFTSRWYEKIFKPVCSEKIFNTAGFFWFATPAFLDLRKLQTASWRFGPFRTGFVETEPRTTAAGKSTLIPEVQLRFDVHPGIRSWCRWFSRIGWLCRNRNPKVTLEIYDFLTTLTARGTDVRWKTNTFSHRKGLPCPSPKFHSLFATYIWAIQFGHRLMLVPLSFALLLQAPFGIWFPSPSSARQAQWTFHDSGFIPLEMFKSMKPQTAVAKFTALSMLL